MKIKRVNIGWSSMTGFGPAAWDKDNHVLNMHTPRHEAHHHPKHADDGEKAVTNQDDAAAPRKEE